MPPTAGTGCRHPPADGDGDRGGAPAGEPYDRCEAAAVGGPPQDGDLVRAGGDGDHAGEDAPGERGDDRVDPQAGRGRERPGHPEREIDDVAEPPRPVAGRDRHPAGRLQDQVGVRVGVGQAEGHAGDGPDAGGGRGELGPGVVAPVEGDGERAVAAHRHQVGPAVEVQVAEIHTHRGEPGGQEPVREGRERRHDPLFEDGEFEGPAEGPLAQADRGREPADD